MSKMANAPVYFTVVQVQFNPVLDIESYIPSIQEKMRTTGFPDYRRENTQQLVFAISPVAEGGSPASPAVSQRAKFVFGNIDKTTEFTLESNSMSLLTTAYDTSKSFFKTFTAGLTIVNDLLRLDFIQRVGIRYFDAILPNRGESHTEYLIPEVTGLFQKLDGQLSHSFFETMTITGCGRLVSRIVVQDGHIGLPPEMMNYTSRISSKFTQFEGRHAILDTDAFNEDRETFNMEKITAKLHALHDEVRKSFYATVTDHALSVWK